MSEAILYVRSIGPRPQDGVIQFGSGQLPCRLGRTGLTDEKREGDGATPRGRFFLRRVFYRPDRIALPGTFLPTIALKPDLGWCDEPGDPAYNRLVTLPYEGRHERLWRDDHLYDLFAVIGYNDDPVIDGAGSAIFLHVAPSEGKPTQGCIALDLDELQQVLISCGPDTILDIA